MKTVVDAIKTFPFPTNYEHMQETALNKMLTDHLRQCGFDAQHGVKMRSGKIPDITVNRTTIIEAKNNLATLNTYALDALYRKIEKYKRNHSPQYTVIVVCYGSAKRTVVQKLKKLGATVLVKEQLV